MVSSAASNSRAAISGLAIRPAAFMRGYGHAQLTTREQTRRRLYSLHLVVIMAIETVYRGHTTPTQYDWARGQIDRMMRLLTAS